MHLFDNSGNTNVLKKRVTLVGDTRDSFVLLAGQQLADKITYHSGARLDLSVGLAVINQGRFAETKKELEVKIKIGGENSEPREQILLHCPAARCPAEFEHGFRDFSIPLTAAEGERLTLTVECGSAPGESGDSYFIALGIPRVIVPQTGSRPNLVLINIDTLRPDHLSLAGYPRDTSPFLVKLAADSAVFENTFAQSSWTPPAVASLFTSLIPRSTAH
jgi:hypothetical protein